MEFLRDGSIVEAEAESLTTETSKDISIIDSGVDEGSTFEIDTPEAQPNHQEEEIKKETSVIWLNWLKFIGNKRN